MEDTLGETDIKQGGAKSNDSIHRILSPNDLVERLKQKGVTFELCSEKDASDYLARSNNYLRAASYRKLYPKRSAALTMESTLDSISRRYVVFHQLTACSGAPCVKSVSM